MKLKLQILLKKLKKKLQKSKKILIHTIIKLKLMKMKKSLNMSLRVENKKFQWSLSKN